VETVETAKQCSDKVLAPKIWIQELIQGIFGLETARCKLTLDVQRKCSSNLRLPGLPFMRHSEPKGRPGVPWRSHLLITSSCSCDAEFLFVKLIWSMERKPLSVSGIWQHMKELLLILVDHLTYRYTQYEYFVCASATQQHVEEVSAGHCSDINVAT
jgi:hypothetical protein